MAKKHTGKRRGAAGAYLTAIAKAVALANPSAGLKGRRKSQSVDARADNLLQAGYVRKRHRFCGGPDSAGAILLEPLGDIGVPMDFWEVGDSEIEDRIIDELDAVGLYMEPDSTVLCVMKS